MSNLTKTIEANGSKGHHKFSLIVEETYVGSGYQNTSDVSFTFKLSPIQNGWDWNGWASKITYKVTINGNEYTGSIGSYNGSSTVTLKSGSETIEHNGDGTKSIGISFQVTDTSGQNYTCGNASNSDTFTLTNIPRYATSNQSLSSATETSFTVSWWSDSTINALWYSIDNGSNWIYINNPNSTSGSYTISNLEENRTYNVKTKVRRADSNLETQSSVGTWTTYSYPKPISSTNFTIGNGATVNLYNPLGRSVTLYILKVGETNNSNHLGYYSGTHNGYVNSEFKTSNAISRQYASIPNSQNGKYYCRVVYGNITKDFTDNNNNTYTIAYNDNEKPVFNASKISYTNSGSHSGFGDTNKFIKGHNNITITIQPMTSNTSANGDYYTISSSGISSQTKTHTGSNITVSNFGNLTVDSITVTAVDKRQQSRSATVNVPWIDYFNPYISNANINRENAIGEKAVINLAGKYTNWSGLNVTNSIQIIKYKIVGIHNSFQNMPSNAVLTNQNGDWTLTATLQDTLSISNNYEIQFQFTDRLETITATGYRIGTADALLWRDLQNKRLGVRKKPDYTLDVNGSIQSSDYSIFSNTKIDSNGQIINNHRPSNSSNIGKFRFLPATTNNSLRTTTDDQTFFKAWLAWICRTYPNDSDYTYYAMANPNAKGPVNIHIYNNSTVNSSTGLPQYCEGTYTQLSGTEVTFGTNNYSFYWKPLATLSNLLDYVYPIGAIFISVNNTNPGNYLGGTWERIYDRFLIGGGNSYSIGSTGGNTSFNNYHKHTTGGHTLTIDEIPAHNHGFNGIANKRGSSGSSYYFVQYNEGGDNQLYINNRGGGGSHSHGDTGYAGSSSQSIMPPYLSVYMWKRTA